MKKYFPLLFLFVLSGVLLVPDFFKSKRVRYEQTVLSIYRQANLQVDKASLDKGYRTPDQPDMAALQEFVNTMDPRLKTVPKQRLVEAYEYTRNAMAVRDYDPPISWEGTGADMGGRTRALMFDPNDPIHKKVWAGSVTGGLWMNDDITNTNSSWEPVDDFWPNLAVSCIAFDPNNTKHFYVGTGEAQTARIIYRESSGLGNGIYKSTDEGLTWTVLASTEGFDYITDLAVRNEAGQSVVYAAVASGTYKGEDHVSQPSDGLFRSVDGGQSWQQVLPEIPGEDVPYTPADIEIAANGRIFVGTMENLNKKGGAIVLYSDSGVSGSWNVYDYYNTKISSEGYYNIPARTIVACAPSDPNRVYAQFAAGYVNGFTYYRGRYMAVSDDGGTTWSSMNIPDADWSTLAWHAFDLKVAPADKKRVLTGGLDLWSTDNAGAAWNHVSDWSLMYYGGGDKYVHADQHNIQFQPGSNTTALFSSDGGVFYTDNATLKYPVFEERNKGYNTLQFYTCAINPEAGSEKYLGGLQDNGTLYYTGTPLTINDMIGGGDGAYCFWDQNEPSVFIISSYYNSYSFFQNGNNVGGINDGSGTFISPADYDYKNNILYTNAVGFFGSNADQVVRVNNIPFGSKQRIMLGTNATVPFSHIKYSPYSPSGTSTLFVGTQAGQLFKITHVETLPQTEEITGAGFPEASISCVAIGSSEDYLLVTFSNYGVSSVWFSNDGGQTWQEKEANLPDMPVRWAVFHPQNDNQALLATETGVWATNTLGYDETEWAPAVDGLANVRVDMLKLRSSDNTVLAATHGRGLFTTSYVLDIYDGTIEQPEQLSKIYPNPASNVLHIEFKATGNGQVELSDLAGRVVRRKQVIAPDNARVVFRLDGLPKGIYFLMVKDHNQRFTERVVVH